MEKLTKNVLIRIRIRIRITLLIPKGKLLCVTTTAPTQNYFCLYFVRFEARSTYRDTRQWQSQPLVGFATVGCNLLLSAATYFTGGSFFQLEKVLPLPLTEYENSSLHTFSTTYPLLSCIHRCVRPCSYRSSSVTPSGGTPGCTQSLLLSINGR